jgi:very-short-patch-repair endonuclease
MDPQTHRPTVGEVLALAAQQHGVVTRAQLLGLGLGAYGIKHRLRVGRLHPVHRGIYAVGRPELTRHGRWMAAVLGCGPGAVLSHESAAALWGIRADEARGIEVSVGADSARRRSGIAIHRRTLRAGDVTRCHAIPVTTPVCTLIDLAGRWSREQMEAAVNDADKLDLVNPDGLRSELDGRTGWNGIVVLREILDRRTFRLTDSALERLFLPMARKAGLPPPLTQDWVNGFRVDFSWPDLGLVVTDGLRYHRTPAQQARDRQRDQVHAAAGLAPLRFTHAQVAFEPAHVLETSLLSRGACANAARPAPTASP